MDSSPVATIAVVLGDSVDGDEDDCNGMRRDAWGQVATTPRNHLPPIVPMMWGVPKNPLRPAATKRR